MSSPTSHPLPSLRPELTMLAQLGVERNLQSVALLADPYVTDDLTESRLRTGFRDYLAASQPDVPQTQVETVGLIGPAHTHASRLHAIFDIPYERPTGAAELDVAARVKSAQARLSRMAPGWCSLVNLVVDSIFWSSPTRGYGSETRSTALGVVWLNVAPHWSDLAICEVLVHETTHSLVFVDERRHGHYRDVEAMMHPEHFVQSAIRTEPRPLYASLHSVLVGVELLYWRRHASEVEQGRGPHPESAALAINTKRAIESIRALRGLDDIALPRVHTLIEIADERLQKL